MEHKGTVIRTKVDQQAHNSNAMYIIGKFELQVDRLMPDFLLDVGLYMEEAFRSEMFRVKTPQLRTIPIGQSIPNDEKHLVSSYDDIRQVIENAGNTMAIANCICRQIGDMVGRSCKTTNLRKACFIISESMAEQYIEMGIGQPATKEEILSTLEKAEAAGLVLQPLNSKQPDGICCCCGDCCGILSTVKTFPRPVDYYASNYYAQVDPQLCTGCEDCIRRCQLDAPKGSDGVVTINLDRCIGCGNCVVICPANAIKLHKKAAEIIPPEDTMAMYMRILSEKNR
jgi:ferredoxin